MKFTTASRQTVEGGVKILTLGPSGIGKTVLTATLPKPILISAESGLLSLRQDNLERIYGKNRQDVEYDMPVIVIETIDDMDKAYAFVTSDKAAQFQSVGLDSVSEIAERVLGQEKNRNKDGRKAYGEMQDRVDHLIRQFRDIPDKNVYMSAKQEYVKDEATGYMKYYPAMPGQKLGQRLAYFFDEVFYFTKEADSEGNVHRVLMTEVSDTYEAKDRSGMLQKMEDPHLGNIIKKIKGQ